MKRIVILAAALAMTLAASAQTLSQEEHLNKYAKQVSRVGLAGLGVEYILDKWEEDWPEDPSMLEARFAYNYTKAKTTEVLRKNQDKFLGMDPVLIIPDSLGNNVHFFQEDFFDENYFSAAMSYIDKAIALYPAELAYRYDRISALFDYEKESPDMAFDEVTDLIELNKTKPLWTVSGEVLDPDTFPGIIQEYCYKFYTVGSERSRNYFSLLSTKMNRLYPKDPNFLCNLGTYYLVVKGSDSKALSYYNKALKLDPENTVAKSNIKVIERRKAKAAEAKKK